MVLLVDYNYTPSSLDSASTPSLSHPSYTTHQLHSPAPASRSELQKARINQNVTTPLGRLVTHYPALASVAAHLDHNDLQNLAATGHHIRRALWQVRRSLVKVSLRCRNSASGGDRCATDLVNPCLKCREAICRNCKYKTKPTSLITRLRRLCPPCQRSVPAAASPYCNCSPDPWVCATCFRELNRADDLYRTIGLFCLDGHDTVVYGSSDGGKIRCARGRQRCFGLEIEPDAEAMIEDSTNDSDCSSMGDGSGGDIETGSGVDQWDALTVALDEMGEELPWGVKKKGVEKKDGGRVVVWETGKWDLGKEWSGELRGWCAWCDRVVLSKVDKRRVVIE